MVSIVVIWRTHGINPVFIRGERIENLFPRLPFRDAAATSAAAKFP
jgi:hypothetical protein